MAELTEMTAKQQAARLEAQRRLRQLDRDAFSRLLGLREPVVAPIVLTQVVGEAPNLQIFSGTLKTRLDRSTGNQVIDVRDAVLHAVLTVDGRPAERSIQPEALSQWYLEPRDTVMAAFGVADSAPAATSTTRTAEAPALVPGTQARGGEAGDRLSRPQTLDAYGIQRAVGSLVSRVKVDNPRMERSKQVVSGRLVETEGGGYKVESEEKTSAGRPKFSWAIDDDEGSWYVAGAETLAAYLRQQEQR